MKKLFPLCFPLFAVCFLISPLSVFGQNFVQRFDKGSIDWSNRIMEAVGIGMPPANPLNPAQARSVAKSEAESFARSSLLELLKGLRIDSRQSVKDLIDQRDEVQDQLRGLLRKIASAAIFNPAPLN